VLMDDRRRQVAWLEHISKTLLRNDRSSGWRPAARLVHRER
jgi:hypothetical protein